MTEERPTTRHLLDPELHPLIDMLPDFQFNADTLAAMREQPPVLGDPEAVGVSREEVMIPSAAGADVRRLLYRPQGDASEQPGYLHIHGGGYIIGKPEMGDVSNIQIASRLGATVLSVDYRLAPEHPIPAPLDDCYAGLAWLHQQAGTLGLDPARIAIGGESAGGGLAAALAILARDRGEYAICHQQLTYPMLDDLTGSEAEPGDPLVGEFIWTRESNAFGWRSYLGGAPAEAPQVPARLDDFSGLPSTWLFTAMLDLFRDENIDYAQRLMRAGVATDLVVYPGACHGFQMLPGTSLGARYSEEHLTALARGLSVPLD